MAEGSHTSMNRERPAFSVPGIPAFLVLLAGMIALVLAIIWYAFNVLETIGEGDALLPILGFLVLLTIAVLWGFSFGGLTPVQPNEARVVKLFGKYDGTLHDPGLQWVNPFTERPKVSVRVRNFETSKLKVNDHDGNPIEIAAVVVWKVTDTAEASFEVNDYEHFVHVQAESALRNLATTHPYDAHMNDDIALRSNPVEIAGQLRDRDPGPAREGRRRGPRGAHQPPRLRAGDRQRHAAPPAGDRGHRGPLAHRRGCGRDGRDGARAAVGQERRRARRGAQGADGEQPAGRPVLGARDQPVVNAGTLYA